VTNTKLIARTRLPAIILALVLVLAAGTSARAVQLQSLTRIKGAESSKLVGMGLVLGLNGTGDGKKSATTMRRLAAMMNRLGDPVVTAGELNDARNVAVVYLSARIAAGGVREGDEINVQVAAPSASSLVGGRLVLTPLLGPVPGSGIYAMAEGPVVVEDATTPAVGSIKAGATLVRDVRAEYLDELGRITLVLHSVNATWPMANMVAGLINDLLTPDSPPIAFAVDQKNVVVQVPAAERARPSAFISQLMEIQLDPSLVRTEARVVINRKTGTIVMTDNVEISPVVISHQGLTITTITPPPAPDPTRPVAEQSNFVGLDPQRRGGARLTDLINAFNQLKVPAAERISIIREIHRSGKLHAQLILED